MSGTPPAEDRLPRVLASIARHRAAIRGPESDVLCLAAIEILDVSGAGLSVHSTSGTLYSVAVAGPEMARIHELERTLGEGPCVDAFTQRNATVEADLGDASSLRWPAFRTEALRTTARAVYGYPLQIDGACFGALNLYDTKVGPLTADQHEAALLLADLSADTVWAAFDAEQALAAAPGLVASIRDQVEVHQATGMVSVQMGISADAAHALLRARAFVESRSLTDVAADVVARRIRFEP